MKANEQTMNEEEKEATDKERGLYERKDNRKENGSVNEMGNEKVKETWNEKEVVEKENENGKEIDQVEKETVHSNDRNIEIIEIVNGTVNEETVKESFQKETETKSKKKISILEYSQRNKTTNNCETSI